MSASDFKNTADNYDARKIEEIVTLAQNGDNQALNYLLLRYKNLVRYNAKNYYLAGADHEDILQEGMIGLFKAIRDFRPDRHASLTVFLNLCIRRQILSAIKAATRQKHLYLNTCFSLDKPLDANDQNRTLAELLPDVMSNPEDMYIRQEKRAELRSMIEKNFSEFEQQVLSAFVDGYSYQEISKLLGRDTKSIDNALQRIRKKLQIYMEESETPK